MLYANANASTTNKNVYIICISQKARLQTLARSPITIDKVLRHISLVCAALALVRQLTMAPCLRRGLRYCRNLKFELESIRYHFLLPKEAKTRRDPVTLAAIFASNFECLYKHGFLFRLDAPS